ncbi:MAG: GtrA family protein [Clostridiales bacterium]|nr:GtrA family protein [Clostridiales bacterium]
MKLLHKLYAKYGEMLRYLFAGGLTTAVSIGAYTFFTRICHINYYLSNIGAWILAVIFAFVINKFFVFNSRQKKTAIIAKEFAQFVLARLFSLGLETFVFFIMIDLANMNDLVTKFTAQIVVMAANYLFSKLIIFRSTR